MLSLTRLAVAHLVRLAVHLAIHLADHLSVCLAFFFMNVLIAYQLIFSESVLQIAANLFLQGNINVWKIVRDTGSVTII